MYVSCVMCASLGLSCGLGVVLPLFESVSGRGVFVGSLSACGAWSCSPGHPGGREGEQQQQQTRQPLAVAVACLRGRCCDYYHC